MAYNAMMMPLMGQLALQAAQDPAGFAKLAASKGVPVPTQGSGGAGFAVGNALAGQQGQAPLSFGLGPAGVNPEVVPNAFGLGPNAGTPADAMQVSQASAPPSGIDNLLAGLSQVQAPPAPQVGQAPIAPAIAPPGTSGGGPNASLTALLSQLLLPQGAPEASPTLGSIIGGTYRRFA